jgi:uncharacterized protein DUF3995
VTTLLALVGAAILGALGALHIAWAVGRRPYSQAVIPTRPDGTPLFSPSPGVTLGVAGLLFAAAFLVLERAGLGPGLLPPPWRQLGAIGVATVLLLRGIGDFRYVGLFKRVRGSPFARLDTTFYTPLALALAAVAGFVATTGK